MTVEIAVMNRAGVALAADSAIFIETDYGGRTSNSSDKIFKLSGEHAVGIMYYGQATFCAVYWDSVISTFDKNLGKKPLATLKTYSTNFSEFLSDFVKKNIKQKQEFHFFIQWLEKEYSADEISIPEGMDDNSGTYRFIESEYDNKLEAIKKYNILPQFKSFDIDSYKNRAKTLKTIKELLKKSLRTSQADEHIIVKIHEFLLNKFIRNTLEVDLGTGIVIAGYGFKEYFPSVIHLNILPSLNGELNYRITKEYQCEYNKCGEIISFARDDMIKTYLQQVNPCFRDYIIEKHSETLYE